MAVIEAPVNTPAAWSARAAAFDRPWDACGWSFTGQIDRHAAVLEGLCPQPGESLLDWGCGTGELAAALPYGVAYCGFDSADGMIERARREHPSRRFTTREPLGYFDLIACIGPFNLPGGWSKQHTWHTLRHLWETKEPRALAVSLYAGDDENCLRYTNDEVTAFGLQLAAASGFRVKEIRNDLLLVVRR